MNLDFWELILCVPSLLNSKHSTKDRICIVITKSSKGLHKLKDPLFVVVHLNYSTNS